MATVAAVRIAEAHVRSSPRPHPLDDDPMLFF
jgi:hypothetical protein